MSYLLKGKDVIIINSNGLHSLYRTKEKNTLLAMKINKVFFDAYASKYNKIRFDYSFIDEDISESKIKTKIVFYEL